MQITQKEREKAKKENSIHESWQKSRNKQRQISREAPRSNKWKTTFSELVNQELLLKTTRERESTSFKLTQALAVIFTMSNEAFILREMFNIHNASRIWISTEK